MDVTLDATLDVVRRFVERKRGKSASAIQGDTALLRDGHLDSFSLVELIAELEQQLEISLPDGSLIPEDFETPQVLYDRLREI
ncbi:MAG TPA: acyl carrier protein [Pirellulales bacterium]|jgi:acyl carrier protein|nr:acyl carrier protein [Pirellulales bacterium]